MQIITRGKNIELTPTLRTLASEKVGRLARFTHEPVRAVVEFSAEHTKSVVDRYIVRVTMRMAGMVFRAEERAGDAIVALDEVVDELEQQLQDWRSRERAHIRGRATTERFVVAKAGPTGGEYGPVIPPPVEESEVAETGET